MNKASGTPRSGARNTIADHHMYQAPTQAMINSLGEGLIVTNEYGAITTVNAYALAALGFTESELIGKWLPKTIIAVDEFGRALDQLELPIVRALSSGQTVSARTHYQTKAGRVIPIHVTASPILTGGTPTGAIEVFRDLTTEHQLDVAKEEFVSLASHQLRTPATAVKSILSMLSQGDFGPLTANQKKYIDKAMASNDRQLQVIESLLNAALVDAGKMELDLDYIDLVALLREVVSEQSAPTQSRQQIIKLSMPKSDVRILADKTKLRMVLDNLISNASKYSPHSSIIRISLQKEPHHAIICVSDQGVGIPTDELPKLFTKFTRLENDLSHEVGGSGLGLFLTKNIVELHHGALDVDSKAGEGSTFKVVLPTKWSLK